jgi:RimJ/RimL family protein N-acetyltransferase
MEHEITVEGYGVRLRPIRLSDAAFVHGLRRTPELAKFIGDTDPRLEKQVEWLEQFFQRDGDYYFIVETLSQKPLGTIGIYNMTDGRAEWGRWVLLPGCHAAPASALLMYRVAFEMLKLRELYCRTVEQNVKVLSFHDHCGLERTGYERNGARIRDEWVNLIVHTARAEEWDKIRKNLHISAKMAERWLKEEASK